MEWHPELRKQRKAPFKRKLTHLLLKILETEKMNVDLRYIDLSNTAYPISGSWGRIICTCSYNIWRSLRNSLRTAIVLNVYK